MATKGTLSSELFNKTVATYPDTEIIEQIGYGLVELIEEGKLNSPEMDHLLHSYLEPMIEENIDYLVLGCSHYPYLIPQLKKILPRRIKIIDSGEAVAKQTYHILNAKSNTHTAGKTSNVFYSNGNPKVLEAILNHQYKIEYKDF